LHILATKTEIFNLRLEDTWARIVAAWKNPHVVANAARYKQQGQQKLQWNQQCGSQPSGSGPKPQGQGQQQQQQQPRQNPQSGSGTSSGSGDEKKKCKRSQGKGKQKANAASAEQTTPEYTASSAITCPAVVSDSSSMTARPPLSPSTHALVERIKGEKVPGMRISLHQLSQSEFSPSISLQSTESDEEIVYDTSPFFAAFYDHSVDDSDESPNEWSDDEPYVAMGIINSYLEAEPVRTHDPRPTPYQKAKVKALEHWDACLGAVTMVTDSDESIAKSPDYVVQPVMSLPKTRSFLMEVDESSGPEMISVLALVSEDVE
jgi:hypothetical protein